MFESTETFFPIKFLLLAYSTKPDPSNPTIGVPYFRRPYLPWKKLMSEGLIGAYFILIINEEESAAGLGN